MSEIDLIAQFEPESFIAEAYRKICVTFSTNEGAKQGQVILFTSVLPGDGTSATVANMAVTMAKDGQKTLLIDCNFRNPVQDMIFTRLLGMRQRVGLGDYLRGMAEPLMEAGGKIENLWVMSNGVTLQNPARFFSGERMHNLLQQLRHEYDVILLDLPAVLPVTDAISLLRETDGVILTVAAGRVSPKVAGVAKERLEKAGGKILGVILNKVKQSWESGYKDYEYYRKL